MRAHPVDIRKVKKLIDLVKATGVAELEIKEGEESVKISLEKHDPAKVISVTTNQSPLTTSEPAKAETSDTKTVPEGHMIRSPMVGTVYLAPSPGTPPFVKIGQKINKGDTLCIIEAMKMFNKVEADAEGTISACLVENGQAIEFEQGLFVLEEEKH
jgi:acetyl-CoA carboxylase biotin carboxyl carrier protein